MADEVQQTAPVPQPSSGGKNKGLLIAIIVLIVVFLGAGFFIVNSIRSGNSKTSNSTTSASTPTDAPATIAPIVQASYICQDKKTMKVTYNNTNHTATAVLSDGRTLELKQQESGSGTQYGNSDGTIVLHGKGNSAFLEENGKQTYQACSSGS